MTYILIFIPVLMAMAIALRDQYSHKKVAGSILLSITSILVMARFCVLAYYFDGGEHNRVLDIVEQVASMYIIPFTYMFLSEQCGTHWDNRESTIMLGLPLLSLYSLMPILHGIPFRDGIVIIQCLVIAFCMKRLWSRIQKYHLPFSKHLKTYFIWMAILLAFTILSFAIKMDRSLSNGMHWTFFIFYTIIITVGYLLIPNSFHIQRIDTAAEVPPTPQEHESTLRVNDQLIEALHRLMEEELYYLQPNINIDDMAQRLGTNRTYITRLMRQEYGLSFIEYVNVARIQYSQKLLYTSPNMTLDEVAQKSGFQSTSTYCRAFKRYTDNTPKGWLQTTSV